MGSKRVHEVAKELAITSAELITKVKEWGLHSGNLTASNNLESYQIKDIKERFSGKEEAPPTTVIRRRRKKEDAEETTLELKQEAETGETVEKESTSEEKIETEKVEVDEEISGAVTAKTEEVAKKEMKSEAAKTIQRAAKKTREVVTSRKPGFEPAKIVGMVKPSWIKPQVASPKPVSSAERSRAKEDGTAFPRKRAAFRPLPQDTLSAPVVLNIPPAPPSEDEERRRPRKRKSRKEVLPRNPEQGVKPSVKRREVFEKTELYSERGQWDKSRSRRGGRSKKIKQTEITLPKAIKRRIKISDVITVIELAKRLSIKAGDIIKKLMTMGVVANLNQSLDFDTALLVAAEFNYEVEKADFDETDILIDEFEIDESKLKPRPPVVTIMGHVDHGKTSLLDYIRETKVRVGEAGGITQHIGAYHVEVGNSWITFLDTPGHEAFTSMRSRGAQVTDIVILIVAADDGVMPQTKEAANHAKAANVPIIVAVNKIDKPGANSEQVLRQMSELGLIAESWGGDTVFVEVSAKTGQGVDGLLDMILLQADLMELKAVPTGRARGHIIEARLDIGRGPVATVLVQEGELKTGQSYVCGVQSGRVRALIDNHGQRVEKAGPSMTVEIQGLTGVPEAGDEFIVLEDEKQARQISENRLLRQRETELSKSSKLTLENLFDNIKAGAVRDLNLIIKADVHGSLEAIVEAMNKLSTPEIKVQILHQSTGGVSETDIMLGAASNALVIGFGVRPSGKVQELADSEQVEIRYYDVIYKLIDEVKEAMAGLLDPIRSEEVLGQADVRDIFHVSKVGTVAGSHVTTGKIVRGANARLIRNGTVIYDGIISSIRRIKDDVREVVSGYECGIGLENYNDVKVGDTIEAYVVIKKAATVEQIDEGMERAIEEERRQQKRLQEEIAD